MKTKKEEQQTLPEVEKVEPELSWFKKKSGSLNGKQWVIGTVVLITLFVATAFIVDPGGTLKDFSRNGCIPCDELTTGDKVHFEKAVFTGTFPDGKFSHLQEVYGEITKKSYWAAKNMIMLQIKADDGKVYRVSDVNIYRNSCKRELWDDELKRADLLRRETDRLGLNEPVQPILQN